MLSVLYVSSTKPETLIEKEMISNFCQFLRILRCNVRMAHFMRPSAWITSKDENREMMAVWPDILRDLTEPAKNTDLVSSNLDKWLTKVLQYNVLGGTQTRALSLVYAYKMLAPSNQLTEEYIRLARILGWCVELLASASFVLDDIEDQSLFRRNKPCWYQHNDLGLAAINDGVFIENSLYYLLQKHFKGKDCYIDLLETFHDITLKTKMGQALNLHATNFGKKLNLDLFTMDRYNSIAKYKTGYFFVLPITVAIHLARIKDPEMFKQTRTIMLEMGHFFQVQDDYLGCYRTSDVMGKDNTDIEEGKCTWLIVVALQRATLEQRKILDECYGSSDKENVRRVKQLYNALGLPNIYAIYEEKTYNLLNTRIQQISRSLPHSLFLKLLDKIYRKSSR